MPVPKEFENSPNINVKQIMVNGRPVAPKKSHHAGAGATHSAHQLPYDHGSIFAERRRRVDMQLNSVHPSERHELRKSVDLGELLPLDEAVVTRPFGSFNVPQRVVAVSEKAARGEEHISLLDEAFELGGQSYKCSLRAHLKPWRRSHDGAEGRDAFLDCAIRRVEPSNKRARRVGADAAADDDCDDLEQRLMPTICVTLELAERWSEWTRLTLSVGDEYVFELADRRRLVDLVKYIEGGHLPFTLLCTTSRHP